MKSYAFAVVSALAATVYAQVSPGLFAPARQLTRRLQDPAAASPTVSIFPLNTPRTPFRLRCPATAASAIRRRRVNRR